MLKLFLKFEFEKIVKYFKNRTLAKVITSGLFLIVFVFIALGIYHFFVSSFRYIHFQTDPMITQALLLFLYELFLLVLFGITVFSSTVSGIFNLFRGNYDNWLLSSPKFTILPKVVLLRSLFTSLLPAVVLFLPAALALNKVYSLGTFGLLLVLVSVLLFLITVNALTLLFILIVGYIYYIISKITRILRFTLGGLITLLLAITAYIVTISWKTISNLDLLTLFKNDLADNTLDVASIGSHFNFLPTHPLAMEIIHLQSNQQNEAISNFVTLLLLALISVALWFVFSFLFYPLWQKFQEGNPVSPLQKGLFSLRSLGYKFTGSSTQALFKKESLVFSRNWKGVLWLFFLFLLWLMQIGANIMYGHNLQKSDAWGDLGTARIINLQVLQFIIAIYFISSFTLRFVFPSFSVERKASWILGSAPLSFKKIFFGKYLFYTSFFVFVGILMNYISNSVLHLSFTHGAYSMLLFISTTIFIVTLGLTLGAVFPNTETDDAEAITTSMPGLFFTALALIYGALSDVMLYIALTKGALTPLISFVSLTLLFVLIMLVKAPAWSKQRAF